MQRGQLPPGIREAISDLLAEYGISLDEDRLEDWVALFVAECDYKIVTRENVEQGYPNVMMWCDNQNMLRDRIESYRHVNESNLHWDRHIIGPPRYLGEHNGAWAVEASYSLFQTDFEGASRLFSVGRYRCEIVIDADLARFRTVLVIADTGLVPTLLASPI